MSSFTNPYAKKKTQQQQSSRGNVSSHSHQWQQSTSTATAAATAAASAAPADNSRLDRASFSSANNATTSFSNNASATTSFSQSFQSIEDAPYYRAELQQQQQQQRHQRGGTAEAEAEARAQQRAFERETGSAGVGNNNSDANNVAGGATTNSNTAAAGAFADTRDNHQLLQPHVMGVSTKQRGNGVLEYVRNVPWQYCEMVPDYIMGTTRCALFLSMKYHSLYPNYIHRRIAELKTDFELRVLLVLVDVQDNANTLRALNKLAVVSNMTMVCCWSEEEAARYLECIRAFEGKDATLIQKKEATNFADQVSDFFTACKTVNKTDAGQLVSQFGSVRAVAVATMDQLGLVPGIGEVKLKRLYDAFHKPFSTRAAAVRKRKRKELLERENSAKAAKEEEESIDHNEEKRNAVGDIGNGGEDGATPLEELDADSVDPKAPLPAS